jgi:membrane protein
MILDYLNYLDRFKIWRRFTSILDRIIVGKHRTSLYDLLKIFLVSLTKDDILERAKAITYNFTLAIFPGIIFLFTLIPYIPIPNLQDTIMGFFEDLDLIMIEQVRSTVEDIISRPRGELLSFGVIFAVYLSTNGMLSLITNFNFIYKTKFTRGFFKNYLVAFVLTLLLILIMTVAMGLLIGGQIILNFLLDIGILNQDFLFILIITLRFIILFIIFQLMISIIYYFGPSVEDRWHFMNTGSVFATLLCIASSYMFSYYLTNFASYNKFYGSIGAVIAFMIWLYLLSVILLLGFVINVTIDRAIREDYEI